VFAYSEGNSRSYRRVYSSAGATWSEGEPAVGKGAAKYTPSTDITHSLTDFN
jgi:hypothetical protein